MSVHILSYKEEEKNLGCKILYCARINSVQKNKPTTSNKVAPVYSLFYSEENKNIERNFLSCRERERDSNVKVPLLDGPSYIYHVRAREKIKV